MKRVLIEIALDAMDFETISRLTGALAAIENIAVEAPDQVFFSVEDVNSTPGRRKQVRADAKDPTEREVQPQVIAAARAIGEMEKAGELPATTTQIAARAGIKPNSIRTRLGDLARRGVITRVGQEATTARPATLWNTTEAFEKFWDDFIGEERT